MNILVVKWHESFGTPNLPAKLVMKMFANQIAVDIDHTLQCITQLEQEPTTKPPHGFYKAFKGERQKTV